MKNFKDYVLQEDANLWIASQLADKYKNSNIHMDLSDKNIEAAIDLYKENHPNDTEAINGIDKDKIREIIKKRNNKKDNLTSLAQEGDYKKLSLELEKLSKNENTEVQKKVNLILPKVRQLSAAASVVTEDEKEEELRQEIINACKEIDDLILKDNNTPESREQNVAAQEKMKDVYKELYNKYSGGDLKKAASFLNSVAKISGDQKTLSFEELKVGWGKISAGNQFVGKSFVKDNNLTKGVKFLIGCLCLKLTLGSDIFGGQGVKVLEKEGIKTDANVNDAISSLKVQTVDKSIEENFNGIRSSENFLKGLEGLFRTLERLTKQKPVDDLDPKAQQNKEQPETKPNESPEIDAVNKDNENTNQSETENNTENKTNENSKPSEAPKISDSKTSDGSNNTSFKITSSDTAEAIKQKVDDFFGDGSNDNRGSLFNYWKQKIEELKNKRLKNNNNEEEVNENYNIYSIVGEKILNERLGAFIKNRAGISNVGRISLNSDRAQNSMSKMFDTSTQDMENYQSDFVKKAQKYSEIISSPIEGTKSQISARSKLNVLAITYNSRLADCYNHAVSRSRYNEIGLTGKEIGDNVKNIGKGIKKNLWDDTKQGKTEAIDKERIDRAANAFDEVWQKLDKQTKALVAHAILKNDESTLKIDSILMREKNGTLVPVQSVLKTITDIALSRGDLDVKNKDEVESLLFKISKTEWFNEHKDELMDLERRYNSFEKAYDAVCKEIPMILKAAQTKQPIQNQQQTQNQQQAQNQEALRQNQVNASETPINTQAAGTASVVTESFDPNQAMEVVNVLKQPSLDGCKKIASYFGSFDPDAIYNAILRWTYEPKNKKLLNSVQPVQATVTTSSVGTVIPTRMYAKAIRRRIDKFAF